jgi:hypothetical protein
MESPRPPGRHPAIWTCVTILLVLAVIATLWVPFYARTTPKIGDFPFFYWYQLIWVPIVAILSWLAYLLSKRARPGRAGTKEASGTGGDPAAGPADKTGAAG